MIGSKMNRRRAFTLLASVFCLSLAGMAVYGQSIGGAHLRPQHREFVNNFLASPEGGMRDYRVAVEKDCSDKEGLQEARGNVGKSYHPYYALGDFNQDGIQDFAIVFVKKADRASDRFKIVIFEGLASKSFTAKWNSEDMNMGSMGIFYTDDHGLYYGGFQAEDCIRLKPFRGGYAEESCKDQ